MAFPIVIKEGFEKPYFSKGHNHFLIYKLDGSIDTRKSGFYIPPVIYIDKLNFFIKSKDKVYRLHDYIEKVNVGLTKTTHYFKVPELRVNVSLTYFVPEEFHGFYIEIRTKTNKKLKLMIKPEFSFNYVWHRHPIREFTIKKGEYSITARSEYDKYLLCTVKVSDKIRYERGYITYPLKSSSISISGSSIPRAILHKEICDFECNIKKHIQEKNSIYRKYVLKTVDLETPDKELNDAFIYAKYNIELLRYYQPNIGGGYFAGIPNFPEFFGRDTFYSLPGILMFGDTKHAKSALSIFARYQSRVITETKKLGEIAHEIWLTGEPDYYSADSTILFIHALYHYYKWTGDFHYLKDVRENIDAAVKYIKNNLRDYFVIHKSEGFLKGITWMDSYKRTRTAVEIQAQLVKAMEYAAELAKLVGDEDFSERCKGLREKALTRLNRFWMKNYYADRKHGDKFDRTLTFNPVVVLMLKLADRRKAKKAIKTILNSELWVPEQGIRTRAPNQEKYDPGSYHKGSIWPHTTALFALACFKNGEKRLGWEVLKSFKNLFFKYSPGFMPECFNGKTFTLEDMKHKVSTLQLWGAAIFIQAVVEGFFGIEPIPPNKVKIKPNIIPSLKVRLNNLKIFNSIIDVSFNKGKTTVKVKKGNIKVIK